jgi:lipopolysaccharide/colanic/teichoic acid biosynthesis glycosyltransferase
VSHASEGVPVAAVEKRSERAVDAEVVELVEPLRLRAIIVDVDPLAAARAEVAIDVDELTREPEGLLTWHGGGLSWQQRAAKRILDVFIASLVLILSAPVLLTLAAIVRLTSPGPAFFRQERIGQFGQRFVVIKLRTMRSRPAGDSSITIAHDPRVTGVGGFLRATRLDELPQFWNVLRGEMSLVGPRPDVPGFADALRGSARRILLLRPGITGPATLYFRNEAEILAEHPDPDWLNEQVIYPYKVELNLSYLDAWTFAGDLSLLLVTALPGLNRWLKVVREEKREYARDEVSVPAAVLPQE